LHAILLIRTVLTFAAFTVIESKMLTYIFEVEPAVTAEIARKLSFDNKSRLELVALPLNFSRHTRFHYYEK
jgi:hypothetical protein